MNLSFSFDPMQLPEFLGLALVHFIWQGAMLAALLGLALLWIPRRAAALRHNLACVTLFLLLLAPIATFLWILATTTTAHPTVDAKAAPLDTVSTPVLSQASPAPFRIAVGSSQWLPWISGLWVVGVFVFSLRWVRGFWQVHRLRTQDTHPVSPEWAERFDSLCARMGLKAKVRLLESTRLAGPIVLGWLRPMVLMPMGLLSGMPTAQVESLLLHELAHIRGNDALINLCARFAETVLFYHPAVWWVVGHIELEREKRCDDAVREAMGEGQSLAEALLSLCELETGISPLALAAAGSSVGDRVRRLADQEESNPAPSGRRRWGWMLLLLVLGLGASLIVSNLRSSFLYQSAARIRMNRSLKITSMQDSFDPYLTLVWMEFARSEKVLREVISHGALTQLWNLSEAECIEKLRARSDIHQYRSTSIFEIRCADEDSEKASELANVYAQTITKVFAERLLTALDEQRISSQIKSKRLESEILEVSASLAQLRTSAEVTRKVTEPGRMEMLTDKLELLRELKREDERRKFESMNNPPAVEGPEFEIIDSAKPQKRRVFWRHSE